MLQGMKKHKLLREDVLPAMATNRKVQRLLNEFMDLLSEYETSETNFEEKNLAPSTSQPATHKLNSNMPVTEQMDSPQPAATPTATSVPATVQDDCALQTANQTNFRVREHMDVDLQSTDIAEPVPLASDQMNLDAAPSEILNSASPGKEKGS